MTERLLELLRQRANSGGIILARANDLQEKSRCSFEALEQALSELSDAGNLEILSPAPFFVIALKPRPWSGSGHRRAQDEQQITTSERSVHGEVPVSSAVASAIQQREVGGVGEGVELLETVLAALGPEADRAEFAQILTGQPAALIERCLKRVQSTKTIRVSRAALFRSLLTKLQH